MARPRGFPQVRQKRRKGWEEGPGQLAAQASQAATTSFLLAAGLQLTLDGLTLLRLRGDLTMQLSASSAALDGFTGAFGIGVTTLQAFTIGVTAVPTPIDEQGWDGWIYWNAWSIKVINATLGDGGNSGVHPVRMPIDTKAMRKLREDDVIFAAMQIAEVGTASLETHFDSRVLLALP